MATPYGLCKEGDQSPHARIYQEVELQKSQIDLTKQWKTCWTEQLMESYKEKKTKKDNKCPQTELKWTLFNLSKS